MTDAQTLHQRFENAGQAHVFAAWQELDEDQRAGLIQQAAAIDLELVSELGRLAAAGSSEASVARFEPPTVFPLERDSDLEAQAERARQSGAAALRRGQVGFILVAGGQGSRLGFNGPKGAYPAGPVSRCSLFEWHARRLHAARRRYEAAMPLYVMTSATNDEDTRAFFEGHEFFGLPREDVMFFQQAMLPALDQEGRILMAAASSIFLAPNGHGGSLQALAESGALENARERGIDAFSYFQVDNPLARPADPLFLGLHMEQGARMSSKVVAKRSPDEKVGVLGSADGKLGCIEYSDLPADLREARDASGRLMFRAGNIAVHLIQRSFIEQLTAGELRLPWHLARKTMKVFDRDGSTRECEGVKFETFVFDALAYTTHSVTLEVDRSAEFSPIKNAEGEDSPASSRRDLTQLFASWLSAAGIEDPPRDETGLPRIEVDPRLAEYEDEFLAAAPRRPALTDGGWLFA